MILRTSVFIGLDIGLVVHFLLLVWSLCPNPVLCNCISPQCLITSDAKENLTHSTEASRGPMSTVSEVKRDNDPRPRPRSIYASALNTSVNHAEGEINYKPMPIIIEPVPRPSTTNATRPTSVLPQTRGLSVGSQIQAVPKAFNASVDHIQTEDFPKSLYKLNTAALLRGFYVFGGLGAMVVMYILVRTIRLRRKKSTVRRYGILTNHEDVEMTPLGADDDEDTTIFEMNTDTRT